MNASPHLSGKGGICQAKEAILIKISCAAYVCAPCLRTSPHLCDKAGISEAEGETVVWCAVRKAGLQSRRLSGIINRIWVTQFSRFWLRACAQMLGVWMKRALSPVFSCIA